MQYIKYEELLFLFDVGHYFLHTQDWQALSTNLEEKNT
jgi:hypothetical protein